MNNRYYNSNRLIKDALRVIPLGSQTFSKSITAFPRGVSPLFIEKGLMAKVWDVDGNEYLDFINGLASVTMGYSNDEINSKVVEQLDKGVIFSLPNKVEIEVAKIIIDLVPSVDMVRFGKNGTDVTSAAIRLARAYTGRDHVLVCGYHGWQDWYIGSTTRNLGVPDVVKKLTHKFEYNNIQNLKDLFEKYKDKVAAVIMEPMNVNWPIEGYLQQVESVTKQNGALFILDEMITGFRYAKGGAQELFNLTPDLTVFGKGIANGFPLSVLSGKREVMTLVEDIFFSGTFGGETVSLIAAKSVLNKVKNSNYVETISALGSKLINGVNSLIDKYCIGLYVSISGHPAVSYLVIKKSENYTALEIKTLFLQEVFLRGVLVLGSHNISYSHTESDIDKLLSVYDEVFQILEDSISNNKLHALLTVEPLKPLFKVR